VGIILPLVLVGIFAAIAIPAYQDYVESAQQVIESQNLH
jgi:Tfp pilus assembly major pilin PilA